MVSLILRALVATALVTGAAVLPAGPAAAHPFGDPQTVAVTFDQQRPEIVHVRWRVGGPDDLTALGVSLGLLPAHRLHADGTVDHVYTDPGVVGGSATFSGYLLERITVTDGVRPCTGVVEPVLALALKGATADFTCPGPVTAAGVGVRMLTDLNPAYRTLATGPDGQRAVYDGRTETHTWTATATPAGPGLARSAFLQLAAVAGVLLLTIAGAVLVARRLRRQRVAA
ncbi:hypothetical protein [Symbioplanes lichenis]|uniref:hypothetical protein n=1 Tax=Symbioplanes lichenis TaxID=1629072 RepID=UPI002739796A|nr:hypothetical protein [Actinoplanes lichenis]